MHLFRDLLDKQLLDRNGREAGKVDGVVLEMREGRLTVAMLEVGWPALARRLGDPVARWTERLFGRHSIGKTHRIPWSRVLSKGRDIKIDLDAERSALLATERWLRAHVVGRMPGGRHGKE
jgi:sporulation protein YlmC with PRC-barrel domain